MFVSNQGFAFTGGTYTFSKMKLNVTDFSVFACHMSNARGHMVNREAIENVLSWIMKPIRLAVR